MMGSRFAGDVWFRKQVDKRTREALRENGQVTGHMDTTAKKKKYAQEYEKQEILFRKERQAKKAAKREKFLEKEKKTRQRECQEFQKSAEQTA